jgi:L-iditol 2-dehydrogenase
MKLARYIGNGQVAIADEPRPSLPEGGLMVKTEACGLCSGELMDWYMDAKIPHVLGHEVAGVVTASESKEFPVGSRVFPHHHAPCLQCDFCHRGLYVHCSQWKSTKLDPGGMAEEFAVPKENLNDTLLVDDMRPQDAALIEPMACVVKAIRAALHPALSVERKALGIREETAGLERTAVIGLGVMGLMHMLAIPGSVGYEINPKRIAWAERLGMDARTANHPSEADCVFVCPGNQAAMDLATHIIAPGGTIVLFAPMPPGTPTAVYMNSFYFRDAKLVSSYSCGPDDTRIAAEVIRRGTIKAEQVVSDFIGLDELPRAYQAMKKGEILKAMVMF